MKTISVALGQSAVDIHGLCKPAQVYADDDPWLAAAAAGGGSYVFFFAAEGTPEAMLGQLDPRNGSLYAVLHYPTDTRDKGTFVLPGEMSDKTYGDFVTLKTPCGPEKAKVATVALGMSTDEVKHLFPSTTDLAREHHAIVFDSVLPGSKYLLLFTPADDTTPHDPQLDKLSEVICRHGDEPEAIYLLPRSKRGKPVAAEHRRLLGMDGDKIMSTPEMEPAAGQVGAAVSAEERADQAESSDEAPGKDETDWGPAAEGVSVRLTEAIVRPTRSGRTSAELLLRYDARNQGRRILHLPDNGLCHQIEVDGVWYEWVDPRMGETASSDEPAISRVAALLDFEPGRAHRDQSIHVAGNWRAIPKGKEQEYAARHYSGYSALDDEQHGEQRVLAPGQHRVRMAIVCPSARAQWRGVVRAVSDAVDIEVPDAPTIPRALPIDSDARQRFLEIERIARLPMDQQAKELPRLYKDLALRYMNFFVEGLVSSPRSHILDDTKFGSPGSDPTTSWARQLADASSELTPEEVADKLGHGMWLNIAARARAIQVFKKHTDATAALIRDDLEAEKKETVQRAAQTIQSVGWLDFTDALLETLLRNDETSESALRALTFMRDAQVMQRLLEEVKKDPRSLIRFAGLLQGPLWRKPADPLLLELLNSPDAEIRYAAVRAVYECSDPKLAPVAVRFAVDRDKRFRVGASYFTGNLPKSSFFAVREQLLPLLSDEDDDVRFTALKAFAQQKDLAAATVILDLLKQDELDEGHKVTVMQSMNTLTGTHFNYFMHEWGPGRKGNRRAIEEFEEWLRNQSKPISITGRARPHQ